MARPSARDVAFLLAPLVNAAGRLGEADLALGLLTTSSDHEARTLATYLESRNQDRRALQDRMFEEALSLADPDAPAILVTKEDWHAGVMGIVASKLLETFHKPVYVVAQGKVARLVHPGIARQVGVAVARPVARADGGDLDRAARAQRDQVGVVLEDLDHADPDGPQTGDAKAQRRGRGGGGHGKPRVRNGAQGSPGC